MPRTPASRQRSTTDGEGDVIDLAVGVERGDDRYVDALELELHNDAR